MLVFLLFLFPVLLYCMQHVLFLLVLVLQEYCHCRFHVASILLLLSFQIGVKFSPAVLKPGVFASTAEDMIFAVSDTVSFYSQLEAV